MRQIPQFVSVVLLCVVAGCAPTIASVRKHKAVRVATAQGEYRKLAGCMNTRLQEGPSQAPLLNDIGDLQYERAEDEDRKSSRVTGIVSSQYGVAALFDYSFTQESETTVRIEYRTGYNYDDPDSRWQKNSWAVLAQCAGPSLKLIKASRKPHEDQNAP